MHPLTDESEADSESNSDVIPSGLVNLDDVDLADLSAIDNVVLADSLQRIREEIEHPEEAVAGFNSSV